MLQLELTNTQNATFMWILSYLLDLDYPQSSPQL